MKLKYLLRKDPTRQMSEAFLTAVFLSLSGGFQDAYSYLCRGGVFANAQTGNIVLLSVNLLDGKLLRAVHYLVPLLFFALGILVTELIRERCRYHVLLHWRQLVVAVEMVLLFLVAFLPQSMDMLANGLVSFSCAMQVQSFRKVEGFGFSSTMCIGNLRSGMEALCAWLRTRDRAAAGKAKKYFYIILLFALGAGIGGLAVSLLGRRAIWGSCGFLFLCFLLMFIREEETREEEQEERKNSV